MFKKVRKHLVYQHDQQDCGIACLLSAVRVLGYHSDLEYLRQISGTTEDGTSLLGLKQAALEIGYKAEAYKANLKELREIKSQAILHIKKHESYFHFILYLGFSKKGYHFFDPDDGPVVLNEKQLENIWESKALLLLENNKDLILSQKKRYSYRDWIKPILQTYQTRFVVIVGLGMLGAVLAFTNTIFMERLIDVLLPSGDTAMITKAIMLWAFLLCLGLLIALARSHFSIQLSKEFSIELITRFLKNLFVMPKMFF